MHSYRSGWASRLCAYDDGVGLLGGDDAGRVMAVLLFYPSRRVQKSGCEVGGQVVAEARCFVDNLDGVLWPLMGTERVI